MTRSTVHGPFRSLTATSRFSRTLSDGKTRRPWGTSPSPRSTTRFDIHPVTSRSLNITCPRRGGVKPTMERIKRGLAHAVAPHQADDLAGIDPERDALEHVAVAVVGVDLAHVQHQEAPP